MSFLRGEAFDDRKRAVDVFVFEYDAEFGADGKDFDEADAFERNCFEDWVVDAGEPKAFFGQAHRDGRKTVYLFYSFLVRAPPLAGRERLRDLALEFPAHDEE